jgi:hypothetical protein
MLLQCSCEIPDSPSFPFLPSTGAGWVADAAVVAGGLSLVLLLVIGLALVGMWVLKRVFV